MGKKMSGRENSKVGTCWGRPEALDWGSKGSRCGSEARTARATVSSLLVQAEGWTHSWRTEKPLKTFEAGESHDPISVLEKFLWDPRGGLAGCGGDGGRSREGAGRASR